MSSYGSHRNLHPFPTRRSSDLPTPAGDWTTPPVNDRGPRQNSPPYPAFSRPFVVGDPNGRVSPLTLVSTVSRSEEHTSELQSQSNLVCRLLLEKKNNLYYLYCI